MSLNQTVHDILAWQKETFPKANRHSVKTHLLRELGEYIVDPYNWEEAADVVFLMLALMEIEGVTLEEILQHKLGINRARVWGEPDEDGVVEHVRGKTLLEVFSQQVEEAEVMPDWKIRMYLDGELPG